MCFGQRPRVGESITEMGSTRGAQGHGGSQQRGTSQRVAHDAGDAEGKRRGRQGAIVSHSDSQGTRPGHSPRAPGKGTQRVRPGRAIWPIRSQLSEVAQPRPVRALCGTGFGPCARWSSCGPRTQEAGQPNMCATEHAVAARRRCIRAMLAHALEPCAPSLRFGVPISRFRACRCPATAGAVAESHFWHMSTASEA
eukprot:CAMPEP_0185155716 /NCGR_PEP_ID=MMETSP1139-20130426/623_1 /TAXON_ID=298111 /ORGANISM="Pavlova sp., Strain CCMP459" /LENGTH=195 /DNA_ID=CAMNT_0027720635 /DNA_START=65 /DNA_END=649 /DNA_ORIENTATION=+